jgi:hypothetical protein
MGREPSVDEVAVLEHLYNAAHLELGRDSESAAKLVGSLESSSEDRDDQAAWTVVARAILNLDEFLTRE